MEQPICGPQRADGWLLPASGYLARALLAGAFLLSASFDARSATETWNPAGGGGNGTWDTVTDNWNPGQTTWTDSNDAVFSGTGGTVTVVNPDADSLTFSASGPYLLQSGTVTLTGSNVTMNSDATIAGEITSTVGLYLTGPAALTLTGSTALSAGNLEHFLFNLRQRVVW
ncbi:MAG: hypothetical protein ABSE62_17445 [Chthoniobacteraceae bacterium]|jgi:fibronectin-binding autotransporter adhesin